jgi:hypothetical protein
MNSVDYYELSASPALALPISPFLVNVLPADKFDRNIALLKKSEGLRLTWRYRDNILAEITAGTSVKSYERQFSSQ